MRACVPLLVAAALAAGAARGEIILLAPQEEVAGGGSVRIDLLITNEDAGAVPAGFGGGALTRRGRRRYTGEPAASARPPSIHPPDSHTR